LRHFPFVIGDGADGVIGMQSGKRPRLPFLANFLFVPAKVTRRELAFVGCGPKADPRTAKNGLTTPAEVEPPRMRRQARGNLKPAASTKYIS
jgi:hypothetical protein